MWVRFGSFFHVLQLPPIRFTSQWELCLALANLQQKNRIANQASLDLAVIVGSAHCLLGSGN